MSKVTFTEAAKATGLHRNTLRNWREAGKLTSASARPAPDRPTSSTSARK